MERSQYVAHHREAKTRTVGLAAFGIGGVDAVQGWHVTDAPQLAYAHVTAAVEGGDAASVLAGVPHTSTALIAGGLTAAAAAQVARQVRGSDWALRRRILRGDGWMTAADLRRATGLHAARRSASATRPSMNRSSRWRPGNRGELAPYLGRLVSGGRTVRGRGVYGSWQHSYLVLGEPGSGKSEYLANNVLDHPGPAVVTSTKPEFYLATGEVRRQRGPVRVFDPYSDSHGDDVAFRWDIVAGCADGEVAAARAEALTASAAGAGDSGQFWVNKGRTLITALLCAADLAGYTLEKVAAWLQREDWAEPYKILENARPAADVAPLTEYTKGVLYAQINSGAKPASASTAQTASQTLEFMANPRLCAALCPDGRGQSVDFEEFIEDSGTLYLVAGAKSSLAPIISAISDEINRAAKRLVLGQGHRLDPPLAMVCDEAAVTLPSVPLHDQAAENRGWGITMWVATQNGAQLREKWGEAQADTLSSSLQTQIVMSCNLAKDRKNIEERVGTRSEMWMAESEQGPDTLMTRTFGNPLRLGRSTSLTPQPKDVPIMPAWFWSQMEQGHALVIPTRGRAGVISFGQGLKRGEEMTAALRARAERDHLAGEYADAAAARARRVGEAVQHATGDRQTAGDQQSNSEVSS